MKRTRQHQSRPSRLAAAMAGLLALALTAVAQSSNQITAVAPNTAAQGTSGLTVTFTLDTDVPPAPPVGVLPTSVTLGTLSGSSVTHGSQYAVTAVFDIPADEAVGAKDAAATFTTPNGTLTFSKAAAFQVTAGTGVAAGFSAAPTSGAAPLAVTFTDASAGTVTSRLWAFGDGAFSAEVNPSHIYTNTGSFTVSLTVFGAGGSNTLTRAACIAVTAPPVPGGYPVVDTGQAACYDTSVETAAPAPGAAYAGQDAQYAGNAMAYAVGADGLTVYDGVTGLTWTQSPDLNDDGTIDADDKITYAEALAYPATLNAQGFGGFSDWRLPSIKELYSLMNFFGKDISSPNPTLFVPFIDTNAFAFGYGDESAGDRLIDAQFATTTLYVDTVMNGSQAMFGLNLADGRIKGYPTADKGYYAYFVRGNTSYGQNQFTDNGDGTVTDHATGLMWQRADSASGLNWQDALAYAEGLSLAGYRDWRLPNAKELQSLVDYTRAPGVTASAAIDPVFSCTPITNEAGVADYPWYWTATTHASESATPGSHAAYVCFGRALGYMNGAWLDVHGAGCQRSDPKAGSLSDWTYTPYGYYNALAPQGDAVRIFNFVRCVRGGATEPQADTDADGLTDWYETSYAGTATGLDPAADDDGDGARNAAEQAAGTSPTAPSSVFRITQLDLAPAADVISWSSELGKRYTLCMSTNLVADACSTVVATDVAATPPVNVYTAAVPNAGSVFYRVSVEP